MVERSTNLVSWSTLTNLTVQNLTTNLADAESTTARFYRARVDSIAFAPGAITGQSFNSTITAGEAPFSTNGIFRFEAGTTGNDYLLLAGSGATNGSGTYTYTVTGPNTATISYSDSSSHATANEQIVFTSPAAGYYYTTNAGSAGFQFGTFKMAAGPALFLGNVRFTPDASQGASALFTPGMSLSLSVTDSVGYVWSLSLPSDALLTSATISMTPFAAGVDSSQSALPIVSGVQLGPEGTQFSDGVTLTLTAPSAPGSHATLLTGAGDGTGLLMVATTNQANAYTTTLFHFSSGSFTDPSDPQWTNYVNENLPQALAAYNQASNQVKALEQAVVQPPEPPGNALGCAGGSPGGFALQNSNVQTLFAKETMAIENLLAMATVLELMTGNQSYLNNAQSLAVSLVGTAEFRKINSLFSAWSANPTKFQALATAALKVSHQDQLLGGPGLMNVSNQLASLASGNVLNYYWRQLIFQHDYTVAPALLSIENTIQTLGGAVNLDQFVLDVDKGFAFDVIMIANVSGIMNLQAFGTVTVTGTFDEQIMPIGTYLGAAVITTNNFKYSYGTIEGGCEVALPLQFSEGAQFSLNCANSTVDFFIYRGMGSYSESWSCDGQPLLGETDVLPSDFAYAFQNYLVQPEDNLDCTYDFPVDWANMQIYPASQTFTGVAPDGDAVSFLIQVLHDPSSAPSTLSP